jgi:hypothetical protein
MAAALVDYGRWHSVEPKPEDLEEFQKFPGEGIQGKNEVKNILITERLLTELPEQLKSPNYILIRINNMIHISN